MGNPHLSAIASALYRRGGVVSAVCHGSAGLFGVRDSLGKPLEQGRRVTGFANLEERLTQAGGHYHRAFFPFAPHLEEDARLVSGQNPSSAGAVGRRVATLLATRDARQHGAAQG